VSAVSGSVVLDGDGSGSGYRHHVRHSERLCRVSTLPVELSVLPVQGAPLAVPAHALADGVLDDALQLVGKLGDELLKPGTLLDIADGELTTPCWRWKAFSATTKSGRGALAARSAVAPKPKATWSIVSLLTPPLSVSCPSTLSRLPVFRARRRLVVPAGGHQAGGQHRGRLPAGPGGCGPAHRRRRRTGCAAPRAPDKGGPAGPFCLLGSDDDDGANTGADARKSPDHERTTSDDRGSQTPEQIGSPTAGARRAFVFWGVLCELQRGEGGWRRADLTRGAWLQLPTGPGQRRHRLRDLMWLSD
jgi:hypothetical protein